MEGQAQGPVWGLRATRLYDGERFQPGSPLVLVDGGRITGVDLTGAHPSDDLPIVDLGDVTLLPGLVDAHVHLAFEPTSDVVEQVRADDEVTLLDRMRGHARQALNGGITTIRDLGDRGYLSLALREELRSGVQVGPELLAAGPPITTPRGHCWFLGGEAAGVAGLKAAVAERVERGVDVIKVMATGGGITPGSSPHESQYNLAELRTVIDAAHAAGLPVTSHAHGGHGIADAVRAGTDGVEHCTFMTPDGPQPDWTTVRELVAAQVWVGVTAGRLTRGVPLPPRVASARTTLPRMRQEGVRLVCSSDAGVVAEKPHDCLPYGLPEFAAFAELSNAEALATVTGQAAASCGVGDRKGRIAPGYDADLLAVAGDLAADLEALPKVHTVFRAGRRV